MLTRGLNVGPDQLHEFFTFHTVETIIFCHLALANDPLQQQVFLPYSNPLFQALSYDIPYWASFYCVTPTEDSTEG